MPSLRNLKNFQTISTFCHSFTFTLFPIIFKIRNQAYTVTRKSSKKRTVLFSICIMHLIYTMIQFLVSVSDHNISNLIQLLFNGFTFIDTVCIVIYSLGFYFQANEFCILMNTLVKYSGGFVQKSSSQLCKSDNIVTFIILVSQVLLLFLLIVFIPTFDIYYMVSSSNTSKHYKVIFVLLTLLRMPSLLFSSLISMTTISICFIIVKELQDNLNDLKNFQKKSFQYGRHMNNNWMFGFYYRKFQIFTIIINECFQIYFWPVIQFVGALVCIGLSYTLLVYRTILTDTVNISLLLILILILCCNCFVLEYGSQSLTISSKILTRGKADLDRDDQKWFRKFLKSCSPIALRVGSFHKIDRQRLPCFVRFILQRTFFFVVKSRVHTKLC